ncbi:hypothetical protein STEG23_008828 [Scotinomys teguina]
MTEKTIWAITINLGCLVEAESGDIKANTSLLSKQIHCAAEFFWQDFKRYLYFLEPQFLHLSNGVNSTDLTSIFEDDNRCPVHTQINSGTVEGTSQTSYAIAIRGLFCLNCLCEQQEELTAVEQLDIWRAEPHTEQDRIMNGYKSAAGTWKQPRCPSTEEWIRKMWYIYTMEYYAAEKNNDIMKFAGKWMELENVILSEFYWNQKAIEEGDSHGSEALDEDNKQEDCTLFS